MPDEPTAARPAVLTVLDHYCPGFKAGGPVQTIMSLVEHLGREFAFDIATSDRDLGDRRAYPGIEVNRWTTHGQARVLYLSRLRRTIFGWWWMLRRSTYDVWYFNSLFSRNTIKALVLRRVGLVPQIPVIVAPRGELQSGALGLKPRRKAHFLAFARVFRLYDGVVFQASNTAERRQIVASLESLGWQVAPEVRAAANLPRVVSVEIGVDLPARRPGRPVPTSDLAKAPGHASFVFLSRVSRMKNLEVALRVLAALRGDVSLDIYGPIEDRHYWAECRDLMRALPPTVRARHRGVVEPDRVAEVFSGYHLFLFPSRGENFGHVIIEALQAGCPVLTTDRTPWADLEPNGAGWSLPLEDEGAFVEKAQHVVDMDGAAFARMRLAAHSFATSVVADPRPVEENRELFRRVLRT